MKPTLDLGPNGRAEIHAGALIAEGDARTQCHHGGEHAGWHRAIRECSPAVIVLHIDVGVRWRRSVADITQSEHRAEQSKAGRNHAGPVRQFVHPVGDHLSGDIVKYGDGKTDDDADKHRQQQRSLPLALPPLDRQTASVGSTLKTLRRAFSP